MKPKIKENDIKTIIKTHLQYKGYTVYRINNTGIWSKKFNTYIFHGTRGVPDLIALKKDCKPIFVECKSSTGKAKPEQIEFMNLANSTGHIISIVANSLEDIEKLLVKGDKAI